MTRLARRSLQATVLLLLPLLGSACNGSSSSSSTTLFQDSFTGSFPGTGWTGPTLTGAATAAIDATSGALMMTTPSATATASTTTISGFNNPFLSISLTMADKSTSTTQLGVGTVTILDATPALLASASWDNSTGIITFHINGATDAQSGVLPADGAMHHLVFNVNSAGVAIWTLDSGAALVTHAVPGGLLRLSLGATFGTGTAWPSFFFDNVSVASP